MLICKICGKWLHHNPMGETKYDKCFRHTLDAMGFKSITKEQWVKNQNKGIKK